MVEIDTGITENDLLSWLDAEIPYVTRYNPALHITAEDFAKHRDMSVSWARRELEKLVKAGAMERVDVLHSSGKAGSAYRRV